MAVIILRDSIFKKFNSLFPRAPSFACLREGEASVAVAALIYLPL